jgi:hypothetical protein
MGLALAALVAGCELIGSSDLTNRFGVAYDHIQVVDGEERTLTRNRDLLSVSFESALSLEAIRALLVMHKMGFEFPVPEGEQPDRYLVRVHVRPAEDYYTEYGSFDPDRFGNLAGVRYALPVYELEGEGRMYLTDEILLTPVEVNSQLVDSLVAADHLELIETKYLGLTSLLRLSRQSPANALQLSNRYADLPAVEAAEPNFVVVIRAW